VVPSGESTELTRINAYPYTPLTSNVSLGAQR
jgi:hypothetical protein